MKFFLSVCSLALSVFHLQASELLDRFPNPTLDQLYSYFAKLGPQHCDIGEHMPVLYSLAKESTSVTEIGLGGVVSTWALLKGLADNGVPHCVYKGIDIAQPPIDNMQMAQKLAEEQGIQFIFQRGDDLHLDIEPVDLLFIDSMHTYCHLTYELETFSPKVRKWIAMHDTSEPWGYRDDAEYRGNYSEYPATDTYPRKKTGLWPAVEDFLSRHPEWVLQERRTNCHGFTILRRIM